MGPKPQARVLQQVLADQFGGSADAIVPNVPSRRGRYPGAVLTIGDKGGELLVRAMERPEAIPAISGTIKGSRLATNDLLVKFTGGLFGGKVSGEGNLAVELDFADVRIYEEPAPALAAGLREDETLARARASQRTLTVITRAFEAVPRITVRQKSRSETAEWAKMTKAVTNFNGRLVAEDTIVFESTVPQVIAYETNDVRVLAGSMGAGDFNVQLVPRARGFAGAPPTPEDFGARATGQGVAFAVVASPMYSAPGFGDLPAASASARLVADLLRAAGAQEIDVGLDPDARLTAAGFAAARGRLVSRLQQSPPTAFLLYCVGHSVSATAGASYLIMGDYAGRIADDLKETSPFVPGVRRASHPLSGSNIEDLAKVVAAAAQEMAVSEEKLIAVAELHRELTALGVPFAVIVDGCYPAKAMDELRQQLRFTEAGDYYGLANSPQAETGEYFRALATFGEAPYLRSTNPVIFAAQPGTFAPVSPHPYFASDLVPGVGVLARKLFGTYAYALEHRNELPLGVWLRRLADYAGTGEMSLRGTISWSDFSTLRDVPMVTFKSSQ